jgi:hypothetical protein
MATSDIEPAMIRDELVKALQADLIGPFLPEGRPGVGADDEDSQGLDGLVGGMRRMRRPSAIETPNSAVNTDRCASPTHNLILFQL